MLRSREKLSEILPNRSLERTKIWIKKLGERYDSYICSCIVSPERIQLYNSNHGLLVLSPIVIQREEELKELVNKLLLEDIEKIKNIIEKCEKFSFIDDSRTREVIEKTYSVLLKKK